MLFRRFGVVASRTASSSYSARLWEINSGTPNADSKLEATLPGKVVPLHVIMGNPAQRASLAVV